MAVKNVAPTNFPPYQGGVRPDGWGLDLHIVNARYQDHPGLRPPLLSG